MTSSDIAAAIERLDWSGTSLQHQLAMSAAVACLRGREEPPLENPSQGYDAVGPILANPVGEMQLLLTDLLQCLPNKSRDAAF